MRSGQCPKCGSSNVYVKQYGLLDVKVDGRVSEHEDYICTDCGYFECYVTDQKRLNHVKENWKRVR